MEWEYAVMTCDTGTSDLEIKLDAMGVQRWELVSVWSGMFIFKGPR